MFLYSIRYNTLASFVTNCYLLSKGFMAITNFVVVSSVGIKRVVCIFIIVEIPSFFPKTQPVLTFQSIYHENKGKPYYEMFQDYPYSPRWSGLEMAERTKYVLLTRLERACK